MLTRHSCSVATLTVWFAAALCLLGGGACDTVGRWSPSIPLRQSPAAAALAPNGRLIMWSAYLPYRFGAESGNAGKTATAVLKLYSGEIQHEIVANTRHDMFCPGISMLPDGRIFVTGGGGDEPWGSNAKVTSFYNYRQNRWSRGVEMKMPRAYQSQVTLSNGDVFVIGGSYLGGKGGKNGEIWSPQTGWRKLPGVPAKPLETKDAAGPYRGDNHMMLFAWDTTKGDSVFNAGPSTKMFFIRTSGKGGIRYAGRRGSLDAMNGNAVMYAPGKILVVGGSPNYDNDKSKTVAQRDAFVITLTRQGDARVQRIAAMNKPRTFCNSVVLPDGNVVVFGGQRVPVPFTDYTAQKTTEIWDPRSRKFQLIAKSPIPRTCAMLSLPTSVGGVPPGATSTCPLRLLMHSQHSAIGMGQKRLWGLISVRVFRYIRTHPPVFRIQATET